MIYSSTLKPFYTIIVKTYEQAGTAQRPHPPKDENLKHVCSILLWISFPVTLSRRRKEEKMKLASI